ncbi:NAD-dependent epimerase/dehydratase family protein [Maribacter sp. 2-571]|uniref:NAD-dependent epimerase/dehydratase family protein n=1 Tax=Maribacter sp. 2-571 TaxID=3417569 RepID=UPI003D34CBC3
MGKIGIIGATGMLGHHTAKAVLATGTHQLTVIHRATSNLEHIKDLDFESRVGDLTDRSSLFKAFDGLDHVLNCGAYYPTVPKPLQEELAIADKQISNFIEAVAHCKIKKGLYLGGAIAIPKATSGPGHESLVYQSLPSNASAYAQVKVLMDKKVREAGAKGIPIVIGIPPMTFGEYDYGPTTGRLIVHALNRTLPGYVGGDRNVVYAGDAGRGMLLACMNGRPGERYLITGVNINMTALIEKIGIIGGVTDMPKKVPLSLAKLLSKVKMTRYKWFGGELPLLDDTAIAVMSAGQFLDGSKAKKELGYKPQVGIDEMIQKTISWFKEVGYIDG